MQNSMSSRRFNVQKLVTLGMLAALSYVVMAVGKVPVVLFLKYEPKDVIITIAGFIYGPMSALAVSVVVSIAEMLTVSSTGLIGLLMNVMSTAAYACTASYIYQRRKTLSGAVVGMLIGTVLLTASMLLWNYYITPYFLKVPRETVAAMLIPAFLPFNLLKGFLNTALILLIYKPLVGTLRRARIIPESDSLAQKASKGINLGVMLVAGFVLISGILMILVMQGII